MSELNLTWHCMSNEHWDLYLGHVEVGEVDGTERDGYYWTNKITGQQEDGGHYENAQNECEASVRASLASEHANTGLIEALTWERDRLMTEVQGFATYEGRVGRIARELIEEIEEDRADRAAIEKHTK